MSTTELQIAFALLIALTLAIIGMLGVLAWARGKVLRRMHSALAALEELDRDEALALAAHLRNNRPASSAPRNLDL
jgi:hypothetical protein